MKKIIVAGHSFADPKFFNTRVLKIENQDDKYNFAEVLSKATGIDNIESLAISGAGNDWIASSIINRLDTFDSDTMVVVIWGLVDRVDLLLTSEQDYLQEEIETSIDKQYEYLQFNRTFDLHGNVVKTGLRYWPTAHYLFGPKMKLKQTMSHYGQVKHFFENVALVQQLLKSKNIKQCHVIPMQPENFSFRGLIKDVTDMVMSGMTEPVYRNLPITSSYDDFYEVHPELLAWRNIVDWSMFTENFFEFFKNRNLPYICTDLYNNFHQTPMNNYIYITKQIAPHLGLETKDIFEEIKHATVEHCKRYNSQYPLDEELVLKVLAD